MSEFEEELLEPLKLYSYELSYKHQDNIDNFFDELTKKSGVDVEGNKQTCKEYYGYLSSIEALKNKIGNNQGLRVFLIFLTILSFIVGTILMLLPAFNVLTEYPYICYSIGPILILLGIGAIILNVLIVGKKLDALNKKLAELNKKANEKLKLAKEQMAALNALYDWNIPSTLVNKTTPLLHLDKYFDVKKYKYMVGNYGLRSALKDNVSAIYVQSGSIIGNPFLYERDFIQEMRNQVYTGSITISWTTYHTDSKGNTQTVHHTQTLTASISKPASFYYTDTALIYACEAAPNLCFSRDKSSANSMNEKEIEKHVARYEKKLQKMQQDKIKSSFTPLANTKFESLFQAFDRNNEVEFRLLFTPLAQQNMVRLLTSKKPYGDDFKFIKRKMINVIRSDHAQHLDFDGNPYHYYHFDYEKARKNFTDYNMKFFQGIYYDLSVLLSIPLYQQHRDYDLKYSDYQGNITMYEAEILANYMDVDIFKPMDCDTKVILKARYESKGKYFDFFKIDSYGFRKEPRVDYVEKKGGDGNWHTIPVHWFEYIPVEDEHRIAVINTNGTKQQFVYNREKINQLLSNYTKVDDIIYQRGLLSFPVENSFDDSMMGELIKIFSQKEE